MNEPLPTIHGYFEVAPDEIEEYKKTFVFEEKDGKFLFPFYKHKSSLTDYTYLMIKQPCQVS